MQRFIMDKRLLFTSFLIPLAASASVDIELPSNMRGLPADFRQYFYNSELIAQVYINDTRIFDASISLSEQGDIRLLRTINDAQDFDSETLASWIDVLQKGVRVGKCEKDCPSGLMAVEYQLNNSTLKLYTANYETARTENKYITMPVNTPSGVIMYNDLSITNTANNRSWGINSSLTSSLAGWSQKASFQSSGTEGEYHYNSSSLYELYTQKELKGNFGRLGFFTPDNDSGNVETSVLGYDTVLGAMWGTSDALLNSTDSVSAWPVYVTGSNKSIAEVWRDGRLIHTQQLQTGMQALDTRQLPGGIYDITIKIIENDKVIDTQQAQIYKPQGWGNLNQKWRMNLWGGQRRTIATGDGRLRENNPFSIGGGIELLPHPRAIVGISAAASEKEHQARTRVNFTLSPDDMLFAEYSFGKTEYQSSKNTDFRYYHNIPGGGSASIFWRSTTTDIYRHMTSSRQQGNTWGGTLSLRLPWSSSLIVNGQYMDTVWRRGFGADLSATTLASFSGRDINFRLSAYDRPAFSNTHRDQGFEFGVSISLAPTARHTISAETGFDQNQGYTSLNYQWQPKDESSIRILGGGASYSPLNTVLSGNVSADTQYFSGDAYVQHNTQGNTNMAGGNLSHVLFMGDGKLASMNGNNNRSIESALIVDMDSDDNAASIVASGQTVEKRLKAGRNIVPVNLWKKEFIQFTANGGDSLHVLPPSDKLQMQRGSVKYIKIKAKKVFTFVGMLLDEKGNLLKNRYVSSDVSGGVINAEGVLTLDSGISNRKLTVRGENGQPALHCTLPADKHIDDTVQFFSALKCQGNNLGNNNE